MSSRSTVETGTGRKFASALLFLLGSLATFGTAAGFFGATWWGFDRLADWRFPFLVVLLPVAIVYGFVFRRAISAVFLLAAIVNAVLLAPMWLSTQDEVASDARIRVVTFNTGDSESNRANILAWIDSMEADVALLHRTAGDWEGTLDDSDAPYRMVPIPLADDTHGSPIVLARHTATVAPLSPTPGSDFSVKVSNNELTLTIIGLTIPAPGSVGQADRRVERFAAVNDGSRQIQGPVVIAGDLETTRWSHAFQVLSEGLTNSEDGFGYAATWPSFDWPLIGDYTGIPVDHALYKGTITVPYRLVGPDLGPAHRPVLFDVSPTGG